MKTLIKKMDHHTVDDDKIITEEVQIMVAKLKDRIQKEIPDSGVFNEIFEKTVKGISDSYVKELRIEVSQSSVDMRKKLRASIIDAKNNKQYAPVRGGSKEDVIAYLNEKESVNEISSVFKHLIEFARA